MAGEEGKSTGRRMLARREATGGAECHVDHSQGDGDGPIVRLGIQDVLVEDDDRKDDADGGEQHLLHHEVFGDGT
ncbi:hypothetical protein HPP92_017632 [Vanilla planifolia]|uniref:Uncharacterized protein n=1 Tax=Vanilla planifolia TaxID=51239 RepID=A0A835Q9M5_VANPL|nr:hypothetical protein HPP92_017632 [Vanilla planifolia]